MKVLVLVLVLVLVSRCVTVTHCPCHLSRGSSDDGDDDYFEDGNLFSRLEEIRAHLEKELGLEVLRKAYEAVQVLCNLCSSLYARLI